MNIVRPAVICACIAVIAPGAQTPAELLIVNGRVFTAADAQPWAEAVLTRGERIEAVGSPGQLADLAIVSQDIFRVPLPELPKTSSVLTVVGGRVVHESR